jgi:hypothetical protein
MSLRSRPLAVLAATLALAACVAPPQSTPTTNPQAASGSGDEVSHHEGYYYPRITSTEIYKARAKTLEDSDRKRRLLFVTTLAQDQAELPFPPPYLMFAKGDDAEKLIIVATRDGMLDTLYRARALLATFTYAVRQTPLFQDYEVDDFFTFYDLLKLLGFTQVTISDGRNFSHRVTIE